MELQEIEKKKIQDRCEFLKKYFQFNHFFEIKGYSSYQLKIKYFGEQKQVWNTQIELCFENYLDCEDIPLTLKGECVETPLRLTKSVFDLKILLVDEVYREEIFIENQSANTMKVQVYLPSKLRKIFLFSPQFSFLSPHSSFKFPFKILIPHNFQTKLKDYQDKLSRYDNQYRIQAKFVGSKQALHVPFEIIFRVSEKFLIMPNLLDFGLVYKKTASKKNFLITNNTEVVQKVLFDDNNECLEIRPKGVIIILTPGESRELTCIFKALKRGKQEIALFYRVVIQNRSVHMGKIVCRCEVFDSPLQFSSLKVNFPRVQVHEMMTHSFTVTNTSRKEMKFQFIPPPFFFSGLRVFPKCKQLFPFQTVNICIEYHAGFRALAFRNGKFRAELNLKNYEKQEKKKILSVTQNQSKSKEDLIDFHLKDMDHSEGDNKKQNSFQILECKISSQVSEEEEKEFIAKLFDFLLEIMETVNLNQFFNVQETNKENDLKCIIQEIRDLEEQILEKNKLKKTEEEKKERDSSERNKKKKKKQIEEVEEVKIVDIETLEINKLKKLIKFYNSFDITKVGFLFF